MLFPAACWICCLNWGWCGWEERQLIALYTYFIVVKISLMGKALLKYTPVFMFIIVLYEGCNWDILLANDIVIIVLYLYCHLYISLLLFLTSTQNSSCYSWYSFFYDDDEIYIWTLLEFSHCSLRLTCLLLSDWIYISTNHKWGLQLFSFSKSQ